MPSQIRKDLIRRFQHSDAAETAVYQVSAVTLLIETAHYIMQEYSDALDDLGLQVGTVKHKYNAFERAFDAYHAIAVSMMGGDKEVRGALSTDLASFIRAVARSLGIAPYVTDPDTGKAVEPRTLPDGSTCEQVTPSTAYYNELAEKSLAESFRVSLLPTNELGRHDKQCHVVVPTSAKLMEIYLSISKGAGVPLEWLFSRALATYLAGDPSDTRTISEGGGSIPLTFRSKELTDSKRTELGEACKMGITSYKGIREAVSRIAKTEGTTQSDIINEALINYLRDHVIKDRDAVTEATARCRDLNRLPPSMRMAAATNGASFHQSLAAHFMPNR